VSKLKLDELQKARDAAVDVMDILAGKEGQIDLLQKWDFLNDVAAPPSVVKAMADELINLRAQKRRLRIQRIADRSRFAHPAPEFVLKLVKTVKETGKQ
jgi:hypothetical protein